MRNNFKFILSDKYVNFFLYFSGLKIYPIVSTKGNANNMRQINFLFTRIEDVKKY